MLLWIVFFDFEKILSADGDDDGGQVAHSSYISPPEGDGDGGGLF